MQAIDIIAAVVSFAAVLAAFVQRELAEFNRRWRATHPPSDGRRPLYLDIDEVLTDIEDAEAAAPGFAPVVLDKAKKSLRYIAVVIMLGMMLVTVVPDGATNTVFIAVLAGVLGAAAGAVVVVVYEISRARTRRSE
ncbi:MAG: hypothetical protein JXB47_03200 [Anaerolineae bacterium]|nr:hypothetical protein [Anaerolineae bacterium]